MFTGGRRGKVGPARGLILLEVGGGVLAAHVIEDEQLALGQFLASRIGFEAGPLHGRLTTTCITVATQEFSNQALRGRVVRVGFRFARKQAFGGVQISDSFEADDLVFDSLERIGRERGQ